MIRESARAFEDALTAARELYPKAEFPDGHTNLAAGLFNLAAVYRFQGRLADAGLLFQEALDIRKRVFKNDHPDTATNMSLLADVYKAQKRLADAEPHFKDALAMRRRLFKGDHPDVAKALNNLRCCMWIKSGRQTPSRCTWNR